MSLTKPISFAQSTIGLARFLVHTTVCQHFFSNNVVSSTWILVTRMVIGILPAVNLPPRWAVPVIWRFTNIFWYYRLPPKSFPPKNENRLRTAKTLPPYCITAGRIPPYLGFLPLPPEKYRQKVPPTFSTSQKSAGNSRCCLPLCVSRFVAVLGFYVSLCIVDISRREN